LHYNDDVFVSSYGTIGCYTLQPFKIETTTETPVVIPPYRKSFKERELIKQEIEQMIDAKIIVPSISRWAAPVVLIPKPDGSIRFCVDYRGLNKITIADPFPLPRVDEILETVAPASIFSLLDVQKCFWQVILDPKFAAKTAFRTQDGHYEFTRIPFGLKNTPAACVRLMNRQLGDLNFVRAYMDDICVFSSSFNEYFDHLLIVFDRLFLLSIKLNWAKCFFFQHRIAILGHIIEHNKIMMNPLKKDKIRVMTTPKSIKDYHRIMGLFSYYRRYIKNFAQIALPVQTVAKE
jgi:putative transposase